MFMKGKLTRLAAAAAAIVVLAACGSSATTQPTTQPTTAPAATVAPATEAQPTAAEASATEPATEAASTTAPAATDATTAQATEMATTAPAATDATTVTKFNLNTATAEEILSAPNTGNRMVREFEEYRPYTTITQFRREIGKYVDEAQVAEYEKYFYVPVSPNNSDAATLQQLPGVDAAIADQLIAARPYASKDAFIAKLGELTSAEQATAAATYVEAE